MNMKLGVPDSNVANFLTPKIAVFGVGGAGTNAVNNMIAEGLEGVEFIVANTDAQSLNMASTNQKIQLGVKKTMGLGAGAKPEVGKEAALEAEEIIKNKLENMNMLFLTAGMGGGTGTGATPVVAKIAKDMGILTVAFVTKPFSFEGRKRMALAEDGIKELAPLVDAMIVIPNQKLFCIADRGLTFANSFKKVDNVLFSGVKSVTDLMLVPGLVNLDFADVRTVMAGMGRAMMGTGSAEGEGRAMIAVENAILNPLLDNTSMKGATKILVNIRGSNDLTLEEVDEAMNKIYEEASPDAEIIFGSSFDKDLEGKIMVSIVATGLEAPLQNKSELMRESKVNTIEIIPPEEMERVIMSNDNAISDVIMHRPEAFGDDAGERSMDSVAEMPEEKRSNVITVMPHAVQFFKATEGGLGMKSSEYRPKIMQINKSFGPREIFVPSQGDEAPSEVRLSLVDDDGTEDTPILKSVPKEKSRHKTSLFERVTGISKHKPNEDECEPSIFPNMGFTATNGGDVGAASLTMEEGLDIPTFLRR